MVAKVADITDLPAWPRLLSEVQAAAYCGMSDEHLKRHCPVSPLRFGRRVLYDRRRIDQWLDGLAKGLPSTTSGASDWTEAFG